MKNITRKEFLKNAAIVGAGSVLAAGGVAGAAKEICTYADTIAWDGAYDVVVMGIGAAGCSAATYAAKAGAGVLLFDAAPEWEAGGNSRYCAQVVCVGTDKEKLMTYYKALYGDYPYDEGVLDALTDGQLHLADWMVSDFGCDPDEVVIRGELFKTTFPEFPEYEGGEATDCFTIGLGVLNGALYKKLQKAVYGNNGVDIWFNAKGTGLIQDPATKTVVGIEIEKGGEIRKIRAYNGIVMACGGFENNARMKADYLSLPVSRPVGSLWNCGDGYRMVLDINADLWHMNCYETVANFPYGVAVDDEINGHATAVTGNVCVNDCFTAGSFILVAGDGSRLMNETEAHRHGHKYCGGEWKIPPITSKAYLIFDSVKYGELMECRLNEGVPERIVEAGGIEELAEKLGIAEPAVLIKTMEDFNAFARNGEDFAFKRGADTMRALEQAPFYGIPMIPNILNTQGGPRRNRDAQILDVNGSPIPHLYSAGEFGGLTGRDYQGATNIAECLIFGRYAGINAAAPKEPLPEISASPVGSALLYTLGSGSSEVPGPREYALAENEYVGTSRAGIGGDIDVKLTMDGNKISSVEIVYAHETKGFGSVAVETLPAMLLEAQSAEVDNIAGATVTTGAIKEAFLNAMAQIA